MTTIKNLCCVIVLGMLLSSVGCQNTVNSVENKDKTMRPDVIASARVVTDGFLKNRLLLKSVEKAETSDGFLKIQVTAVNARTGFWSELWSGMTGGNPYRIDYKFDWLDKNGMKVDTILSRWRQRTIKPGETVYFNSVSPTKNCKDFMLELKEAE